MGLVDGVAVPWCCCVLSCAACLNELLSYSPPPPLWLGAMRVTRRAAAVRVTVQGIGFDHLIVATHSLTCGHVHGTWHARHRCNGCARSCPSAASCLAVVLLAG